MAEPLINISFQDAGGEIANLRTSLGRFTSSGLGAQRARNETIALEIQSQVTQRIKNKVSRGKRASASTGRLLYATAANGNRQFGAWEMGVGIPKFLDNTQAKYWRTFEEGSLAVWKKPFIGTQLLQFSKNPQRLPSAQYTDLRMAPATFSGYRGGDERYVVKREIEPSHIYRDVAREMNIGVLGTQSALLVLQRIFRRDVQPRGGYFG